MYDASTEIRHSVVFATVIVALVFLPLFLLGSVEGRLLRPLGFAYVVALTASLVVALTVTPVLCSWLLPNSKMIAAGEEPRLTRWLKAWYEPWLLRALAALEEPSRPAPWPCSSWHSLALRWPADPFFLNSTKVR